MSRTSLALGVEVVSEDDAMSLVGRWRIEAMDLFDRDDIDLMEPGFIEFGPDETGQFGFIAVRGWMDCRTDDRGGRTRVEFSWRGEDEGDDVCGRGWAALMEDGTVSGHVFVHLGDDSGFRAVPWFGAQPSGR